MCVSETNLLHCTSGLRLASLERVFHACGQPLLTLGTDCEVWVGITLPPFRDEDTESQKGQKSSLWVWRNGSVVRSVYCSCRNLNCVPVSGIS